MKQAVKLYSVFHKSFFIPKISWVEAIHAGKSNATEDLGIRGDNSGDNISDLNPTFCELTATYWVWKNEDRSKIDFWGLMHYRRYLVKPTLWDLMGKRKSFFATQSSAEDFFSPIFESKLIKDLQKYDIILPYQRKLIANGQLMTIEDQFKTMHSEEHWSLMIEVLLEKYPEYEKSLHLFSKSKRMYYANMMIAPWEIWDKYLHWLFDILFEINRRIEIPTNDYQKRILGFLSERLHNLFIYHNNYSVKNYITLNID